MPSWWSRRSTPRSPPACPASRPSIGDRRNLPPARRLDAHAGGGVHPAGVPRRHHGRLLPRAGAHDGGVAAHVARPGDHAHAVAGGVVHPRTAGHAQEHGHSPASEKAASSCAASFASTRSPCASALRILADIARLRPRARRGMPLYLHLESDFLPRWTKAASSSTTSRPPERASPKPTASSCRPRRSSAPRPRSKAIRGAPARGSRWPSPNRTRAISWSSSSPTERRTEDVIAELRAKFHVAMPGIEWEFPGILSDLIGDLTWSPKPIEVKVYSTDLEFLKKKAPRDRRATQAGQGRRGHLRRPDYHRPLPEPAGALAGCAALRPHPGRIAAAVNTAMLGQSPPGC